MRAARVAAAAIGITAAVLLLLLLFTRRLWLSAPLHCTLVLAPDSVQPLRHATGIA